MNGVRQQQQQAAVGGFMDFFRHKDPVLPCNMEALTASQYFDPDCLDGAHAKTETVTVVQTKQTCGAPTPVVRCDSACEQPKCPTFNEILARGAAIVTAAAITSSYEDICRETQKLWELVRLKLGEAPRSVVMLYLSSMTLLVTSIGKDGNSVSAANNTLQQAQEQFMSFLRSYRHVDDGAFCALTTAVSNYTTAMRDIVSYVQAAKSDNKEIGGFAALCDVFQRINAAACRLGDMLDALGLTPLPVFVDEKARMAAKTSEMYALQVAKYNASTSSLLQEQGAAAPGDDIIVATPSPSAALSSSPAAAASATMSQGVIPSSSSMMMSTSTTSPPSTGNAAASARSSGLARTSTTSTSSASRFNTSDMAVGGFMTIYEEGQQPPPPSQQRRAPDLIHTFWAWKRAAALLEERVEPLPFSVAASILVDNRAVLTPEAVATASAWRSSGGHMTVWINADSAASGDKIAWENAWKPLEVNMQLKGATLKGGALEVSMKHDVPILNATFTPEHCYVLFYGNTKGPRVYIRFAKSIMRDKSGKPTTGVNVADVLLLIHKSMLV